MRALAISLVIAGVSLPCWNLLAQNKAAAGAAAPPASAQSTAPATPSSPAQKLDPKGKTGISPFMIKAIKANGAYTARDYQGAIAGYRDAIQEDPQNPLGHYYMGEAQLAAGNTAEAEASWSSGLRYVGTDDVLHAKLLFVMATLRELQGRWEDAKKAWQDYAGFVAAHPNAKGYAATATERSRTIDVHVDLDTKYAAVKARIEQRLKENGAPPADDGPQGPTKKK